MDTRHPAGRWLAAALAAFALVGGAVRAAEPDDELPARVGRLADVAGRVHVASGERADDWLDAVRNQTVTSRDSIWVAGDGRAEIDYGGGQVRLAGDTNVHVARLDDAILALFVAHGRVIVRVRVLDPGEAARIDTPNTQVALTRPGLYRVDVAPDRTRTEVVVREGEATATFASGLVQVLPGQAALLVGEDPLHAEVRNGFQVDGFDTWSAERDRRYERSRSATYVSRQMIGYADLDDYGRWETAPEYGPVWYPIGVPADWAPYRHGHWTWVGGWGWTWVDDAPWGYAPFHYGRWVYWHGRWVWAPGERVLRPAWSPAMVAWYGGGGWSLSVSYGAPVYGWVPLAWGEPFIPWWRGCSHRCWTHYNRPYAVNLAERPHAPPVRYANWTAPGGVTAVPGAVFTGRRPVHGHVVDARPHVATAPVLAAAPALDKPAPGKIPGYRPPPAAPLPAAAQQTRPMRLPAPAAVPSVPAFGGNPAGTPPASAGRPPVPVTRAPASTPPIGSVAAPPASPPAVRPAPRAPATPGTWGPTGPPGAAPAGPPLPSTAAPPAQYASPPSAAPRAVAPAPIPPRAPAVPPSQAVPRPGSPPASSAPPAQYAVPPSPQPPRAGPPLAPGGAAAVPQVAPPVQPAPAGAVRAAPPPKSQDDGGRVEPPSRPVPREQFR